MANRSSWLLLTLLACSAQAADFVQAVEFPYYQYPRPLWERELVWMKNIGIRTVAFSVPAQAPPDDPRQDLPGLMRIVRRLGFDVWIRGVPRDQAAALTLHLAKHGGPIKFAEGGALAAPPPPAPVNRLSATDPQALIRSRQIFQGGRGSLLWQDVEDTLAPGLRRGVVSLSGQEQSGAAVLRRDVALLRRWGPLLSSLRVQRNLKGAVQLWQANAKGPSAVIASNPGAAGRTIDLRAHDPASGRPLDIAAVHIPAGETLWLPVNIPLAMGGLCDDCSAFAPQERVLYATAELEQVEFENGILALEFYAPVAATAVLQLARRPSGPLVAGGKPSDFEWEESSYLARLPVPAGKPPQYHSRIGLAIAPPEASAFFSSPSRLIIGQTSIVPTSYSSDELARRSRLLIPPGFQVKAVPKSELEIDYAVTVPSDALHGEFVPLALEADGVRLGRARVQVLRPASLRVRGSAGLHFGPDTELVLDPPLLSADIERGRNLAVVIRNNAPAIQNFTLEATGGELKLQPERVEVSVGASTDREVELRLFAGAAGAGLHDIRLRLTGAAEVDQPVRVLLLRRNEAAIFSADLDGDGVADWILENSRVRAVFSGADGRWMEFDWKGSITNLLPDSGLFPIAGPVSATPARLENAVHLDLSTPHARRKVTLEGDGATLVLEQDAPLPRDLPAPVKRDGVELLVERQSPSRLTATLTRP